MRCELLSLEHKLRIKISSAALVCTPLFVCFVGVIVGIYVAIRRQEGVGDLPLEGVKIKQNSSNCYDFYVCLEHSYIYRFGSARCVTCEAYL